jgi:HNH endonuclease
MAILGHHRSWLSAHPNRTEEWLSARLKEGFDVHHLDWDHSNNDPNNLILVENRDHMMIHAGGRPIAVRSMGFSAPRHRKAKKIMPLREPRARLIPEDEYNAQHGEACYDLRKTGLTWSEVAKAAIGHQMYTNRSRVAAKWFATQNDLPWPLSDKYHPNRNKLPSMMIAELVEVVR